MGWTVLYIAFGIVALWLLGEVLLQYKARLRWRLLAFAGFLGVVLGVLIPSVLVIVIGAIAFATGQTYVTLSFRRGFSTGWAIGGSPKESRGRRRRGAGGSKPAPEVSGPEYEEAPQQGTPEQEPADASAVYAPEPLPDDTGQYGIYANPVPAGGDDRQDQYGEQQQYAAYDPYTGHDRQPGQEASYGYGGQEGYQGQDIYQDQGTYADPYGHGTGQAGYAPHPDPYTGTNTTADTGQFAAHDGYGDSHDRGAGQQPADPYAGQYTDTPPGGVWVPPQRGNEQYPSMQPEAPVQPAPYGNGYDTGQDEQYRY